MPTFDVVRQYTADDTFRVAAVRGMFDLSSLHVTEQFAGDIAIDNQQWN